MYNIRMLWLLLHSIILDVLRSCFTTLNSNLLAVYLSSALKLRLQSTVAIYEKNLK